jgi:fibronectin type 3 domain-containing protein
MTIDGIAVSSMTDNPEEINRIKVRMYSSYSKDASIIVSIEEKERAKKIKSKLHNQGYKNITFVDSNLKLINADE